MSIFSRFNEKSVILTISKDFSFKNYSSSGLKQIFYGNSRRGKSLLFGKVEICIESRFARLSNKEVTQCNVELF